MASIQLDAMTARVEILFFMTVKFKHMSAYNRNSFQSLPPVIARAISPERGGSGCLDAVFDRVPMADDEVEPAFVAGVARGVVGDLGFGSPLGFGFGEVDGGALDGDEAPTAGQAALLGGEACCLDAAAHEFAVAFVLRGGIIAGDFFKIIGGNGDGIGAIWLVWDFALGGGARRRDSRCLCSGFRRRSFPHRGPRVSSAPSNRG